MNDRLKFRAWKHDDGKMIYDWEYTDFVREFGFDGAEFFDVMQCIGLKDKNKKLIYEGDLIKYNGTEIPYYENENAIYEIEYVLNKFIGTPIKLKYHCHEYCGGGHLEDFVLSVDREVIGNIFENPELLTGDENAK